MLRKQYCAELQYSRAVGSYEPVGAKLAHPTLLLTYLKGVDSPLKYIFTS